MTHNQARYDVVIIGGGPAGLTAGLYATRGRHHTLLLEKGIVGGQITIAEHVENYPGFPAGISGYDLGQLMHDQATKYGLEILNGEVTGVELQEQQKVVKSAQGEFTTRALIIAGGSQRQKLGVPGEEEFVGRGVSYCATCDAVFFSGKPVVVVGGGDSAISEALHLAKFTTRVTVIHRRHELRASRILQERVFAEPKIDFLWDTAVEKIEGEQFVGQIGLKQLPTGKKSVLEVAGVFVSVGFKPDTDYLQGILPRDDIGHIITDENMSTSIAGVFAAGDIRRNSARQAITAAGDGATAAIYAEKFLTYQV